MSNRFAWSKSRIERMLGPKWRYFPKRSYFRRNRGSGTRVEWHADADGATIFRVAASAINVWMPLDAVGTDLPSLEIVPRSHTAMRRVAMLTGKDRHRDEAFVRALGPSSIPQLQLGDALIFDQFVLHRTQSRRREATRFEKPASFVLSAVRLRHCTA